MGSWVYVVITCPDQFVAADPPTKGHSSMCLTADYAGTETPIHSFSFNGVTGVLQMQLSLGERWGTPWTGHQSISGLDI